MSLAIGRADGRRISESSSSCDLGEGCETVPTIHLRIEPVFCSPASVGTVGLIKLVSKRFGLPLAEAKSLVDRCVFDGETVAIVTATDQLATEFAQEVSALESPAKYHVDIEPK